MLPPYDVGIYIVTVDDYSDYYDSVYETAWQIYHNYTLGMNHFISSYDDFLAKAASRHPVRRSPWGTIAIISAVSMLFALIVCLMLKGKMKSVRKGTQANTYISGNRNLAASRDQYAHTTETRTKIEHEFSCGSLSSSESGGGSGRSGSF